MNQLMGNGSAAGRKQAAANADNHRAFYQSARAICQEFFAVNPFIYWLDFLISATAAYVLASFYLAMPISSVTSWACFFGAVILIYRASMFIHEIVHLPSGEMKFFRRFWNFFAGVPMMVPSFTYQSHLHHHSTRHYGTEQDGEYLPLASGTMGGVLIFLTQIFFQPLLVVFRYLVWTPISFCHSGLRRWTLLHATSLVINFQFENHKRPELQSAEDTFWELLTTFRVYVMFGLVIIGTMPIERLPKIYLLAVFILAMNHIRTLAAHRYTSDGSTISHLDQFLDSTNITGGWLTELICPLGLRYHALHHLFPGIPYYNLGIAHRRLVQSLPADSLYHETVYPTMKSAIGELMESVRGSSTVKP